MARKANPQVENGYIRIANELFVALMRSKFTASERRCIDLVLRLSYGCGKKSAQFQFWSDMEIAGILRQHAKSIVKDLEDKRVFEVDWKSKEISLNKDYLEWDIEMANSTRKLDKLLSLNLLKCNLQVTNEDSKESKCNPQVTANVTHRLPKCNPQVTEAASKATDSKGSEPPKDSKNSYKEKKEDQVDNTIQSNKQSSKYENLPPPSSSDLSEKGKSVIDIVNHLWALQWTPNKAGDYENINELSEYPDHVIKWSLEIAKNQKVRPPGIVPYALGVIRRYNEENQGDIQQKGKAPLSLQQRLDEACANLDYYQKQVDADPRNATDELCIETLAQLQSHIDDIKEMQNAERATAG